MVPVLGTAGSMSDSNLLSGGSPEKTLQDPRAMGISLELEGYQGWKLPQVLKGNLTLKSLKLQISKFFNKTFCKYALESQILLRLSSRLLEA